MRYAATARPSRRCATTRLPATSSWRRWARSPRTPHARRSPPTCSPPAASPSTSPAPPRPPTTWSRRTTGSRSSAWPAATAPTTAGPTRPPRALRDAGAAVGGHRRQAARQRRRLCGDGRRRPRVPDPDAGAAGMSVPKSFAGLPLGPQGQRVGRLDRRGRALAEPRGHRDPARSTAPSTSTGWTRSTPGPGCRRSCAAPTRRCTPPSRGRSGSTPASPPPRSPTRSTAATSRPARRA